MNVLEQRSKFKDARPSDEVESFRLVARWEPIKGAFGITLSQELETLGPNELKIVSREKGFINISDCVNPGSAHARLRGTPYDGHQEAYSWHPGLI